MAADQDWCLTCGTAAPGRLGTRPGWRAAATVAALTLLLVGGAVAASYAALTSDANQAASQPAPPAATPVAQTPPAVPGPPAAAPPVTTPPPAGATTPPAPGTFPKLPSAGKGGAPALPTPSPRAPLVPATPLRGGRGAPTTGGRGAPTTGGRGAPTTGGQGTTPAGKGKGNTTTPGTTTPTTPTTPADTTPKPLAPITLAADSGSVYDPYGRAGETNDTKAALDADPATKWAITAPADGKPMQVGLVIKLPAAQAVRALEIQTDTPGFRLEVYGTDGTALPPDILDSRWENAGSRSKVDASTAGTNKSGDGKERVLLGKSSGQFRQVLLWLTTPPTAGPSVRVADVKLFG